MEIKEALREHRLKNGLSLTAASSKVGVSKEAWRKWENGDGIGISHFPAIAAMLGCDTASLAEGAVVFVGDENPDDLAAEVASLRAEVDQFMALARELSTVQASVRDLLALVIEGNTPEARARLEEMQAALERYEDDPAND